MLLRTIPGVFLALGIAISLPRKLVVIPSVMAALAALAFGLKELMELTDVPVSVVGYGVPIAIVSLVSCIALSMSRNRVAERAPAHQRPSTGLAAAGFLAGMTAISLGFAEPLASFVVGDIVTPPSWRAIRLVQQTAKPGGLFSITTWKESAEELYKATDDHRWSAKELEPGMFLVSYSATKGENEGRGLFWEARLSDSTVRYVNADELLSAKYGLTRAREQVPFTLELNPGVLDARNNGDILASLSGSITNMTGKTLVSADISVALVAVFGERRALKVESGTRYSWEYGNYATARLKPTVSKSRPWRDGETIEFVAKTKDAIEAVYREYEATTARVELALTTSDPIDFEYEGVVLTVPVDWHDVRFLEVSKKLTEVTQDLLRRCRRAKFEATTNVTIEYEVNMDGNCIAIKVKDESAPPEWVKCAENAFLKTRFPKSPHLKRDTVAGTVIITLSPMN